MSTANNTNEGSPVSFIVTGFGPFGTHVPDNPTTHLVQKVKKYCQQQQITVVSTNNPRSPAQEATNVNPPPISLASLITKALVIETSAKDARDQIDTLYQQLCDSENDTKLSLNDIEIADNSHSTSNATAAALTSSIPSTVILLHLGVHTKAKCFHLEQCAYNDATFRIPDQQGFQPQQECIIPQMSHGVSLLTPWNIPVCLETLNQTTTIKWEHTHATTDQLEESIHVSSDDPLRIAVPSTDPGRFVCNYLYCYSLATFCPTTTSVTLVHHNESPTPVDPALDTTANESDRNGSNDVAADDKRRLANVAFRKATLRLMAVLAEGN